MWWPYHIHVHMRCCVRAEAAADGEKRSDFAILRGIFSEKLELHVNRFGRIGGRNSSGRLAIQRVT